MVSSGSIMGVIGARNHKFAIVLVVPVLMDAGLSQHIIYIAFTWATKICLLGLFGDIVIFVAWEVFTMISGKFFVGGIFLLVGLIRFSFSAALYSCCLCRCWLLSVRSGRIP